MIFWRKTSSSALFVRFALLYDETALQMRMLKDVDPELRHYIFRRKFLQFDRLLMIDRIFQIHFLCGR